jgi:hypothetical protein
MHISRHFNISKLLIHIPRLAHIKADIAAKMEIYETVFKYCIVWWKWEGGQTNKIVIQLVCHGIYNVYPRSILREDIKHTLLIDF